MTASEQPTLGYSPATAAAIADGTSSAEAAASEGELALALFELLTHSDITYRQRLAHWLGLHLVSIAKDRDQEWLRRFGNAIEWVIEHVERGRPYDALGILVAQYVGEAAARNEALSKERMTRFIATHAPELNVPDESYYGRILERFGLRLI